MKLLIQNRNSTEERIARTVAMLEDIEIHSCDIVDIPNIKDKLILGDLLPIGTVEFTQKCFDLCGAYPILNVSYPESLSSYYHRKLQKIHSRLQYYGSFIKPVKTKQFTGFVLPELDEYGSMSYEDRVEYQKMFSLPEDTDIWVSDIVKWTSEVRYYFNRGNLLGFGRYDDLPDETPEPNLELVKEMGKIHWESEKMVSYTIDVGVLSTGETAVVECNDFWAIGYYKGTCSHKDFLMASYDRWKQILDK